MDMNVLIHNDVKYLNLNIQELIEYHHFYLMHYDHEVIQLMDNLNDQLN
jgi:hypothetical protein